QLRRDACGTRDLAAPARLELDVMHHGTDGDVLEGQAVAGLDVGIGAGENGVAHVQTDGREDVPLFAVRILQEGDVGAAVGVVLDALDLGGDIVFIALEIDDAVLSSVAAADVADGDLTLVVSAAR